MRSKLILFSAFIFLSGCDILNEISQNPALKTFAPTEAEMGVAMKQSLNVGIEQAVQKLSASGGFSQSSFRIPWPEEAARMERALRTSGLGSSVDRFVETMNQGAEMAVREATPIFVNAIRNMSFNDVRGVLLGPEDAATQFLQRTTSSALRATFAPILQEALLKVELTALWNPLADTYNALPFVQPVNPNLEEYVTDKAMAALFTSLATEEAKIRSNPRLRSTEEMKRVFAFRDAQLSAN
jgi:hypothetical protein